MRKIRKFLRLVLRHRPNAIGITLDRAGWASIVELVEKVRKSGIVLSAPLVRQVVDASDKNRFCVSGDGLRIRANHGHSLPLVDLGLQPAQWILPGRRQMVHLAESCEAANENGGRSGIPVVLRIFAGRMHVKEFRFYRSASRGGLRSGCRCNIL